MPTTKKQSVLVYALNVLLLFNLTVIVVMLSGKTPVVEQAQASATISDTPPPAAVDPFADQSEGWIQDTPSTAVDLPTDLPTFQASSPSAIQTVSIEPARLPESTDVVGLETRPALVPESATQDDAPVTFFGIDIE